MVDDAFEEMIRANEPALRRMLVHALQRSLASGDAGVAVPARQNRRTPLIEAALAPARDRLGASALARLHKALALVVGTEAHLVFKDALQASEDEARRVKRWMFLVLIEAALDERGAFPGAIQKEVPRQRGAGVGGNGGRG